jgi:hypothetical protein
MNAGACTVNLFSLTRATPFDSVLNLGLFAKKELTLTKRAIACPRPK